MPIEFMSAIAFLAGAAIAAVASGQSVTRGVQVQQDILKRGLTAQGRIVRLWRPPLFGSFTRIYFEFHPEGSSRPVRACHIDRRGAGELRASLPAPGAHVSVRYLKADPGRAVIAKLVSRLA